MKHETDRRFLAVLVLTRGVAQTLNAERFPNLSPCQGKRCQDAACARGCVPDGGGLLQGVARAALSILPLNFGLEAPSKTSKMKIITHHFGKVNTLHVLGSWGYHGTFAFVSRLN